MINAFDRDVAPCYNRVGNIRREVRTQRKPEDAGFVIGFWYGSTALFQGSVLHKNLDTVPGLICGETEVMDGHDASRVAERENVIIVSDDCHGKG